MASLIRRLIADFKAGVSAGQSTWSALNWPLPVNGIMCLGMGGSGAGGGMLAELAASTQDSNPSIAHNHYELPTWWKPSWQVMATSYSSETGETLTAAE